MKGVPGGSTLFQVVVDDGEGGCAKGPGPECRRIRCTAALKGNPLRPSRWILVNSTQEHPQLTTGSSTYKSTLNFDETLNPQQHPQPPFQLNRSPQTQTLAFPNLITSFHLISNSEYHVTGTFHMTHHLTINHHQIKLDTTLTNKAHGHRLLSTPPLKATVTKNEASTILYHLFLTKTHSLHSALLAGNPTRFFHAILAHFPNRGDAATAQELERILRECLRKEVREYMREQGKDENDVLDTGRLVVAGRTRMWGDKLEGGWYVHGVYACWDDIIARLVDVVCWKDREERSSASPAPAEGLKEESNTEEGIPEAMSPEDKPQEFVTMHNVAARSTHPPPPKTEPPTKHTYQRWTAAQDEHIIRMYFAMQPDAQIAAAIGNRSEEAVAARRRKLSGNKSAPHTLFTRLMEESKREGE